jgi:CRP-like cAMP-binding protein
MNVQSLERSLAEHPFTKRIPQHWLTVLSGCAKNLRYQAGEYLFREGQPAEYLYLLRHGQVELESHVPGKGPVSLETLQPGEAIGASIVFPPYDWHLDARATTPVLAFALDGACLRKRIAADAEFGRAVLQILLVDVHSRLARARLHQLDVYKGELKDPVG